MTKGFSLKTVAAEWHNCQRCGLGAERPIDRIVFGAGGPQPKYLFVYDVPTEGDAAQGAPLSGKLGDILAELLGHAEISITDAYFTPLLGCRPILYLPETSDSEARVADRAPSKDELNACVPRVMEIIYRIDPIVIFALGDVAWKVLVKAKDRGRATSLDKAIGNLFTTHVPGRWLNDAPYDVIPLMSMKQIIAQPSYAKHGALYVTAKHLHKARIYAEYVEKNGRRDAGAAGFESPGTPHSTP